MSARTTRLAAAAAALALLAALLFVLIAGRPAGADSPRSPIVGKVKALAGTKALRITSRGGARRPARSGSKLRLGDTLDPGAGVQATVDLKIPTGVSTDAELIYVKPSDGRPHDVKIQRTSNRSSRVTIAG